MDEKGLNIEPTNYSYRMLQYLKKIHYLQFNSLNNEVELHHYGSRTHVIMEKTNTKAKWI